MGRSLKEKKRHPLWTALRLEPTQIYIRSNYYILTPLQIPMASSSLCAHPSPLQKRNALLWDARGNEEPAPRRPHFNTPAAEHVVAAEHEERTPLRRVAGPSQGLVRGQHDPVGHGTDVGHDALLQLVPMAACRLLTPPGARSEEFELAAPPPSPQVGIPSLTLHQNWLRRR